MKNRLLTTLAGAAATALALTGCTASSGANDAASNSQKDITVAVFSGWAEGEAASYVWKQVLEDEGYHVTLKTATAGPVFTGLARKDYDVTFDVWLPNTHKEYWDKYSSKLEDLGAWYKDAPLTVAVNKDAPIDSLSDLAAHADQFDNTIVGIEPGAGLTNVMKKSVIPSYGLDKMKFQTSSTAAMLAALKKATQQHQNIAVTLWKPHWAYAAFPIKDLKDPKGALGKPDAIHTVARSGFTHDDPKVAAWLKDFTFDPALLADLEKQLFQPGDNGQSPDASDYPQIVKKWLASHSDFASSLTQ